MIEPRRARVGGHRPPARLLALKAARQALDRLLARLLRRLDAGDVEQLLEGAVARLRARRTR